MLVDADSQNFHPQAGVVSALADRRRGVGFDQLLVLSAGAEAAFHCGIFNSDGSRARQCGNGMGCAAAYIKARKLVRRQRLRILTEGRAVEARRRSDGRVTVSMGAPVFENSAVPFIGPAANGECVIQTEVGPLSFGLASMGNPHAVAMVGELGAFPVADVAQAVRASGWFPEGVNVGFMQIKDAGRIQLRVCERGAGETPACGSAACAATAIGRRCGILGRRVRVELPGGELEVEWVGAGMDMTVPATHVYDGVAEL